MKMKAVLVKCVRYGSEPLLVAESLIDHPDYYQVSDVVEIDFEMLSDATQKANLETKKEAAVSALRQQLAALEGGAA